MKHHDKDTVYPAAASQWRSILIHFGIPESCLTKRHGPCPACGGKDRFRYDDKYGAGNWYCSQCGGAARCGGGGDGIGLLMRVCDMGYCQAIDAVGEYLGLVPGKRERVVPTVTPAQRVEARKIASILHLFERSEGITRDDILAYMLRRAEYYAITGTPWPNRIGGQS